MKQDEKITIKCPKCGKYERVHNSDYFYMTLDNMLMCSGCLDNYHEELFYGKDEIYNS